MITWIGHAGFKIECTDPVSSEKKIIYIDPWFNSPVCPEAEKAPESADLILVTHGHFDHCSDSPDLSKRTGAPIVAIFELGERLAAAGAAEVTKMNKGGTVEFSFCDVTMVPADHSTCGPGPDFSNAGAPTGFVVHFKDGSPSIYHGGDTNVFTDMQIVSDLYQPQVALLPIGGHFTMGPKEAAYALTKFLKSVKTIVPMHYGTFPLLKGNPETLQAELTAVEANVKIHNLIIGQTEPMATLIN